MYLPIPYTYIALKSNCSGTAEQDYKVNRNEIFSPKEKLSHRNPVYLVAFCANITFNHDFKDWS